MSALPEDFADKAWLEPQRPNYRARLMALVLLCGIGVAIVKFGLAPVVALFAAEPTAQCERASR